jgi:hypothetical protein
LITAFKQSQDGTHFLVKLYITPFAILSDGNKAKVFFLNNQPDAPIIQIYSVRMELRSILTLRGSGHQKPA